MILNCLIFFTYLYATISLLFDFLNVLRSVAAQTPDELLQKDQIQANQFQKSVFLSHKECITKIQAIKSLKQNSFTKRTFDDMKLFEKGAFGQIVKVVKHNIFENIKRFATDVFSSLGSAFKEDERDKYIGAVVTFFNLLSYYMPQSVIITF